MLGEDAVINLIGAVLEVGICFMPLYFVLLKNEYFEKWKWIIIGIFTIFMGMILAESRLYTYVSVGVLFLLIFSTSFLIWLLIRRGFITILVITWTYYAVVSIMQIFMIFWGIEYSRGQYMLSEYTVDVEYINVLATARQLMFVFSCILAFVFILKIERKLQETAICEYKNILIIFDVVFSLVFLCYGKVFYNMTIDIKKVETAKMLIFVLISMLMVTVVYMLMKNKMIEKQNDILQLQEEFSKKRYEELAESISKNNHLVHDINNHLIILKEYARNEDNENIYHYIEEIRRQYEVAPQKRWTEHQVIDFILNQKKMEAEQKDISVEIVSEKGIQVPIPKNEICVVLGNLLDNAIEATSKVEEGLKWIKITIGKQNKMTFMKIENNYQCDPIIRNGEYQTIKENKNAHGYGIRSVRRIIKKYDGTINLEAEEHVFRVRILLQADERIQ